jgi:hypothetical protein
LSGEKKVKAKERKVTDLKTTLGLLDNELSNLRKTCKRRLAQRDQMEGDEEIAGQKSAKATKLLDELHEKCASLTSEPKRLETLITLIGQLTSGTAKLKATNNGFTELLKGATILGDVNRVVKELTKEEKKLSKICGFVNSLSANTSTIDDFNKAAQILTRNADGMNVVSTAVEAVVANKQSLLDINDSISSVTDNFTALRKVSEVGKQDTLDMATLTQTLLATAQLEASKITKKQSDDMESLTAKMVAKFAEVQTQHDAGKQGRLRENVKAELHTNKLEAELKNLHVLESKLGNASTKMIAALECSKMESFEKKLKTAVQANAQATASRNADLTALWTNFAERQSDRDNAKTLHAFGFGFKKVDSPNRPPAYWSEEVFQSARPEHEYSRGRHEFSQGRQPRGQQMPQQRGSGQAVQQEHMSLQAPSPPPPPPPPPEPKPKPASSWGEAEIKAWMQSIGCGPLVSLIWPAAGHCPISLINVSQLPLLSDAVLKAILGSDPSIGEKFAASTFLSAIAANKLPT